MESVFLLIPVSVLLVFGIAFGFWWSVRSGQFDDLEGPGFKVLMDDDLPAQQTQENVTKTGQEEAGKRLDATKT